MTMNLFNRGNNNNNFSGNSFGNNRSGNSFQGNLFGSNNNNNNNMRSGNNGMFGNQGSNNNNFFGNSNNNNRNNLFGSNNNSNSNGNNGLGLLGSSSNSNNFMGMSSGSSIGTFNYGYDASKLPKTEKEGYPIMAINANASLKHKSLDELRVEDYFCYKGNKIPQQNLNIIHDQWQKNMNGRGNNGGGNNLFGGNNNNNNNGGNNLFGRNNNNNGGGNLFGGNNNNNGGGLFGSNNNNNNNRGGLFGSNNNNNGGGLFGNNNNNNNGGGLFGSNNNNNNRGGLFGSNNNNNGGGLFGNNNNNNNGGGLFGSNNNNGGGLFGSNNNNRGGLFGNSNGGGLFGSNNNNNGGGLFGNKGGLFGSNNNNNNGGGLFGGQRQGGLFSGLNNGGGLFGSNNNNNNNNNNNHGSSGYYNNEAQLLLEAQKLLGAIDMEQAKNFDAIRLNFGTTQQNYNLFGKSVGASSESTKEFLGRYEPEETSSSSVVVKRTHRSGYKSSSRKSSFYGEGDADSQLVFRNKGFHSRLRDTGSHLLARKANSEDFNVRDRAESWHGDYAEVEKRVRLNSYTDAYVPHKSSIDVTSMYDSIRIYVFLNQEGQEKNCSLNVCFSKTCLEIKRIALEKLFDETEAPLSKYKLVFNNRILRDTTKVKDTQIKENDKIYIIPDSESDNYSHSSFSSPSKDHLASESLIPRLTKEYNTEPSMPRISRMTADDLRNIENFTIFNEYVKVTFEGLTDITGLNLDEIVHLNHRSIEIYPENGHVALPQTGYGLNKAATIEFYQWSVPKKYQNDLRSYDIKLKNWANSIGAEFVSFDAAQGVVCIRVYNFNTKSQ